MTDPLPTPDPALSAPPMAPGLVVIHEDPHLVVLDKPSGLLCVPGRGDDKQDCLSARALARWPDALVVHRLDMATSGLVLMARSPSVQRSLGDAFAHRAVDKRYEAIVDGAIEENLQWATIDAPLAADWPRRPMQQVAAGGKPSMTRWRATGAADIGGVATRLLLEPLTGRTHQLRVHLAWIGHPILGDTLYADESVRNRAPRLLLHASRLRLRHPVDGAPLRFESAAPF
jgi:tRNA pseudouridine32 synthase/23S rRNA pseudouridine746 synthase